jgi:hypothetical protein
MEADSETQYQDIELPAPRLSIGTIVSGLYFRPFVLALLVIGTACLFAASAHDYTVPATCQDLPVYLTVMKFLWLGTLLHSFCLALLARSRHFRLELGCKAMPFLAAVLAGWPMIASFIGSCVIWSRFNGDRYTACQPSTLASTVCYKMIK